MNLGDRIKSYEAKLDFALTEKLPVIVRVDGAHFKTFTKSNHCNKPFDDELTNAMIDAMSFTADYVEDCVFGYTQSDEITFVLRNDHSLESIPWFGNRVQKLSSVIASCVSSSFNRSFFAEEADYHPALFDARVFVVPSIEEAANAVFWRYRDCVKNSISTVCYWKVGEKLGKKTVYNLMQKLNSDQRQELLFKETGLNWSDYPAQYKNGIACYKEADPSGIRRWKIDRELPAINFEWILGKLNADRQ